MKTTFNIHNKQKESLSNATVILRISDKEEYEPLTFKQRLTENEKLIKSDD